MDIPDNIPGRVLRVLAKKGLDPTPFEKKIGLSKGYFVQSAKKNNVLGSDKVVKILLELPDINLKWLMVGGSESEMFVKDEVKSSIIDEYAVRILTLQVENLSLKVSNLENKMVLLESRTAIIEKK